MDQVEKQIVISQQESDGQVPQLLQHLTKAKEEMQRKFGCPCGKWYLSYPALFTHVKHKHEGKPPGQLIKPKTQKARGRPRLVNTVIDLLSQNNQQEQQMEEQNFMDIFERVTANQDVDYNEQFQFSYGNQTCQDMGSDFLRIMGITSSQQRILSCFMNYIKFYVRKRYQINHWQTKKPNNLIEISNELVLDLQNHKEFFPIQKKLFIDLLYVLFQWMQKNKWTDHKLLVRRQSNREQQQIRQ